MDVLLSSWERTTRGSDRLSDFYAKLDTDLFLFFQRGVIVGVVVLTTLILFPGTSPFVRIFF
jgi:hypothetical protein